MSTTQHSSTSKGSLWEFGGLRFAIRNLRRNGLYSIINIVGLAVSLTACTFIFLWVQDERSYDRFHKDADSIYMAVAHFRSDGGEETAEVSSGLFAPTAEQLFSNEVETYCRVGQNFVGYFKAGEKKTGDKGILMADSTFFSFFNFPIVKGQGEGLLQTPNDVVISESLATELFGNDNPIGKLISADGSKDYQVVAVMKDMPANTSVPRVDMVCSFKSKHDDYFTGILDTWYGCEFLSYLRIKPGTDLKQLAEQTTAKQTELKDMRFFTLQPLRNLHLYSINGEPAGIKTVRLFTWIAVALLIIACVNYVNLVTARSSRRYREIGLKKILGARKSALFVQLVTEAALLFFIALIIAVILNLLLLSAFNQLAGKQIVFAWGNLNIWLIYGGMLLAIIALAGVYPALSLSAFRPIGMLQGVATKKSNAIFRQLLVVLQFVASVVLIAGTITLNAQMTYIRKKNLGFDREHVLCFSLINMSKHYDAVKTELLQNTAVLGITVSRDNIMRATSGTLTENWEGKQTNGSVMLTQMRVDSAFINVMRIPLAEGKNFSSPKANEVIINETAAKAMGLQEPVAGKWLDMHGDRAIIVGVMKDFHFNSLHEKIVPLIIHQVPAGGLVYLRTTAKDASTVVAAVEKLWKQYNADYTFGYRFLDDSFNRMYKSDMRTGQLFSIFSIIAIFVSCLGLFGLVTFTAETKTKEIGIRKVLGASVGNLIGMLSKEFLLLVAIAVVVALPLSYFLLDKLLQTYAYRISIGWWIFALAAITTVVLTLLTVSGKALKSARANPVKSIKTE